MQQSIALLIQQHSIDLQHIIANIDTLVLMRLHAVDKIHTSTARGGNLAHPGIVDLASMQIEPANISVNHAPCTTYISDVHLTVAHRPGAYLAIRCSCALHTRRIKHACAQLRMHVTFRADDRVPAVIGNTHPVHVCSTQPVMRLDVARVRARVARCVKREAWGCACCR